MKKKIGETSFKETAFGIIPRSKLIPLELEIEGTKRAWDFVMERFKADKIGLTPDFILRAHKIGFGWIFPAMAGRFRKIDVVVSKHAPPKYYLVDQLMLDFTRNLKTRLRYLPEIENQKFIDELTTLLTWAHHRFLWIHPFADYNGRIGRLLNNMILLNLNLPPIELKVETKIGRKKYIAALAEADNGEYGELEKIIRSAIEESIKEIKK